MNNLIIIRQLPQIEEHLKELSVEVDRKVEDAKSLICTEENVKTIKQVRADLNKEFKAVETKRKEVKEQILAPYMQFEEIYKRYISDKFKSADNDLKNKINAIESDLKAKKEQEIQDYFEEYKVSKNIDFITYDRANINVTLSTSVKSLKEQVKSFIDKIESDLNLIETQEHKEEILVEYKQTLNVGNAIMIVQNRFKAIEEEKKKREKEEQLRNEIVEIAKESDKHVDTLQAPVEEKKEEILTVRFTVKGTRAELKELKEFLESGGYDYE